jgi:subtilisin family serine protease
MLALGAWATTAACGDAETAPEMQLDPRPLHADLVREWRAESQTDSFALHRAGGLAWRQNALYVVDTGNDRIVVLDSMLRPVRSIGRSGAGPGELERPTAATFAGDTLVIADANNQRFDFFTGNGAYIRAVPAPIFASSLTTDAGGRVHGSVRDSTYYAARWGPDGRPSFLAARPRGGSVGSSATASFRETPLLALTSDDALHVFDNSTGSLMKFTPQGAVVLQRSLPSTLLRRLADRRRRIVKSFTRQGLSVRSFPLAKWMGVTGDGMLLLLVADSVSPAMLIDPDSYSYRTVLESADSTARMVRSAIAAAFQPPNLYVLAQDGLFTYRVRGNSDAN